MLRDQADELETKKQETELGNCDFKDIRVKVCSPQIKKGGLFSSTHVTYKIILDPLGWMVRRKESDFVAL